MHTIVIYRSYLFGCIPWTTKYLGMSGIVEDKKLARHFDSASEAEDYGRVLSPPLDEWCGLLAYEQVHWRDCTSAYASGCNVDVENRTPGARPNEVEYQLDS